MVEVWADTDKATEIRITLLLWPYVGLIETSYTKPALLVGSTNGRFYALAQATGKLLWSYDTGAAVDSPAAVDENGSVYVGNSAGLLYAFSLAGRVEWVYGDDPTQEELDEPIAGIVGGPAISDDGPIYITTESGMLQAIDASDGGLLWTWPGELDEQVPLDFPILTSPAIGSAGTIYITRYDGRLYAIAPDGETLWWFEVPETDESGDPYSIQSSPTVLSYNVGTTEAPKIRDLILFGSHSGHMYAVYHDEVTDTEGTLLWEYPQGEEGLGAITSTAAIYADNSDPEDPKTYCWFGAANGHVYELDVKDGSQQREVVTTDDVPVRSSPCIDLRPADDAYEGLVYVGANDGRVYAWDVSGSQVWAPPFDPGIIVGWPHAGMSYPFVSSPCLGKDSDELLFIGGLDGIIYCLGPGGGGAPGLPPPQPLPELVPRLTINKQRDKRAAWYNFDENEPDIITYTLWINNRSEIDATITQLEDEIVDELLSQYVQLAHKDPADPDLGPDWEPTVWFEVENRWIWDIEQYPLEVDARETITVVLKIETNRELSRINPEFDVPIAIHDNPNLDPEHREGAWEPREDGDEFIFPRDNGRNKFDWGQHICLDVRGVGNAERLRNRATVYYTAREGGSEHKQDSNVALTSLGFMHRWLLMFRYNEALADETPAAYGTVGGAQAPTHYILIDSQQARGRRASGDATFQYWRDHTDENKRHVLLVKIYLRPQVSPGKAPIATIDAPPGEPLPIDVAKNRDRPWVPYNYSVRVLQAVALSLTDYGAPPPPPGQPMPPALDPRRNAKWSEGSWNLDKPVIVHNPLDVRDEIENSMWRVNIGGTDPNGDPIAFNPGSGTGNTRVVIKNRTRGRPFGDDDSGIRLGFAMAAPASSGRTTRTRRPDLRNVVRWTETDLLYNRGWLDFGAGYDWYRENTIGQDRVRVGPAPYFEIGPGETATMMMAVDIPKYLHAGRYLAPGGINNSGERSADQYRIYVDLNGNETWDPGEAFFQNESTNFERNPEDQALGNYEPLTPQLVVANQPLLRAEEDTVDLGKTPAGGAAPHEAFVTLRNPGNTLLSDPQYAMGSRIAADVWQPYLEPSWLVTDWNALNLTQPLSTAFIPVPTEHEVLSIDGYDRPVTSKTPVGASEPAGTRYRIFSETMQVPIAQPFGTYAGTILWWTAEGASDSATIKATVVENHLPEGLGIGQGSDIMPAAHADTAGIDLVWCSNTDGTNGWYVLYRDRYDFTTGQWAPGGRGLVSTGTAAYEDGATELRYRYPSLTMGSDGTVWLVWRGTAQRVMGTDNRVFLQRWNPGGSTVAFPSLDQPSSSWDEVVAPQAWIQDVYDGEGQLNKKGVLIWSEGAGTSWRLRCAYATADPSQQGSWSAARDLRTSSPVSPPALAYSRDPMVLSPAQTALLPAAEQRLIHVLFTGFFPYFGNSDICYARYDPLLLDDTFHNNGQQPFAPVLNETLSRDPSDSNLFYTRHKEWWIDWYAAPLYMEPEAPVLYVDGNAWTWNPDTQEKDYNREAGLVTWMINGYVIQYSPSLGQIRFLNGVPGTSLQLSYTPCLLRLTDSRSGDAGPVAVVESPRYWESGEPRPDLSTLRPRMWLFWRRRAAEGATVRLYYKALRYYIVQAVPDPLNPEG
ncbi:hypothetical protein AMK68_05110, partial [candidate division KD3-62 bacterium DG_56]